MYAFNEDKSFFNLGTWGIISVDKDSFVPGATLADATVAAQLAGKYVYRKTVSGFKWLELVCKQITEPCPFWDVIHYEAGTTYFGLKELTEIEQENAELVDAVYFQNDYIYIVLNNKPSASMYIRIKGE